MKFKIILIVSIAFINSVFFQCTNSKTEKTFGLNRYFPFERGNLWEYINEAPRDESEIFSVKVTSIKSDGSDILVEFYTFPFIWKKNEKRTLRYKTTGDIFYINDEGKDDLFIPKESDLKKDYTWQFGMWNGYVAGVNESVKTEAGNFENCILINYALSITFSAQIYLASEKGIVKWNVTRTNPPSPVVTWYVLHKLQLNTGRY